MKPLETLISPPLFQSLGWTLLHFVWQGALVGLLYAGVRTLLRCASSNSRYLAACAALLLLLALPLLTFHVINSSTRSAPATEQAVSDSSGRFKPSEQHAAVPHRQLNSPAEVDADEVLPPEAMLAASGAEATLTSALPWLVLFWLAGATLLTLRTFGGWMGARRLKTRQANVASREWQERLAWLSSRLRVSRPVRLCESALVEVPAVLGWLRPVILVPASVLMGLTSEQVEALLAHELAHVRRHDYLVNLLQTVIETLLFYHPVVWWVSRQIRLEREHCCDDLAVKACGGDVLVYARALTTLEQFRRRSAEQQLVLAANGGSLLKRVRRLLQTPKPSAVHHSPWFAGALVTLAVLGLLAGARGTLLTDPMAASFPATPQAFAARASRRAVAVTFFSLPYARSYGDDPLVVEETTRRLLRTITSNNIPAVGFVGERAIHRYGEKEPRTAPLKMWLDAGLELGTQTYSHKWLYNTPLAEFEEDVLRGEMVTRPLMRERGRELRYFLYPYLNTGPNLETKGAFEKFLKERGYTFAPITIDHADWLFAKVYDEARGRGDTETMKRVADEYVPYMEGMFAFYEKLSVDVVGYEVPQVLMLSASRLNTEYLPQLILMLKRRGYSFISLEEAMKDEAYRQPDTYTGPVGISWLQRWAVTKGLGFRKEPPLPPFMRQFDERKASGSDFKTAE